MTAMLFLGFLAFMVVVVLALTARYLPQRVWFVVLAGLSVWLLYVGLLSYLGVVGNPALRPPGIAFVVLPVFLFVLLVLIRSSAGAHVALAFPLWVLLGMESFRVGVELLLHQLWIEGLVPRLLTYEGGNIDIFVGLSAPFIAWMFTTGHLGNRLALAWNALGLLTLANVAIRSVLSAPGLLHIIHAEVPNVAMGTFPFTFIPGFFAPLAAVLHVLAIRALRIDKYRTNS